jgi:HD-like signal output (HDOD) protein
MPTVRAIARDVEKVDNRFSAIVLSVVNSPQFRMRTKTESTTVSTN